MRSVWLSELQTEQAEEAGTAAVIHMLTDFIGIFAGWALATLMVVVALTLVEIGDRRSMTPTFIAACIAFALPSLFGWWPTHAAFLRAVRERDEALLELADTRAVLRDAASQAANALRHCDAAEEQFCLMEKDWQATEAQLDRQSERFAIELAQVTAERDAAHASLDAERVERERCWAQAETNWRGLQERTVERDEALSEQNRLWADLIYIKRESEDLATLRAQLASVEAGHECAMSGVGAGAGRYTQPG